jgi:hypothetical protein
VFCTSSIRGWASSRGEGADGSTIVAPRQNQCRGGRACSRGAGGARSGWGTRWRLPGRHGEGGADRDFQAIRIDPSTGGLEGASDPRGPASPEATSLGRGPRSRPYNPGPVSEPEARAPQGVLRD